MTEDVQAPIRTRRRPSVLGRAGAQQIRRWQAHSPTTVFETEGDARALLAAAEAFDAVGEGHHGLGGAGTDAGDGPQQRHLKEALGDLVEPVFDLAPSVKMIPSMRH